MHEAHEFFIRESFRLCRQAMDAGNPPFAALLVSDGEILASAVNTTVTTNDPMRHAEMNLLEVAREKGIGADVLKNATLYASNEPCPMCAGAMYLAGIRKVVYGASRETLTRIRKSGLNAPCRAILNSGSEPLEVTGPVLENEMLPMHREYYAPR